MLQLNPNIPVNMELKKVKIEKEGVADAPRPSPGGSKGYPYEQRLLLINMWQGDQSSVPENMLRSIGRWEKRPIPYEMTGGKQIQAMSGHHRFLLAISKIIYHQEKRSYSVTFIIIYSHYYCVFTEKEASTALRDKNMTKKRASTTAFQVLTPINLKCHYHFWHKPSQQEL